MLDYLFRKRINEIGLKIGKAVGKTGLSPNMLTLMGFLLSILTAYLLSQAIWFYGGLLLLFSAGFDVLDGAVARAYKKTSDFGNYIDAVTDKYAEGLVLIGAGMGTQEWMVASIALLGAIMCSYTRHRVDYISPKLSDRNKIGVLERAERVLVLAAGCLLGQVFWALVIIAVLANLTSLLRIANAKKILG